MTEQHPFKWRHFQAAIILLCVRWYVRYSLSYRDLEEIMVERGLSVDQTTIYRWVQRDAPELEKRCRPHVKACNDCWRVDETTIKVKKGWVYLSQAAYPMPKRFGPSYSPPQASTISSYSLWRCLGTWLGRYASVN